MHPDEKYISAASVATIYLGLSIHSPGPESLGHQQSLLVYY